MTANNWKKEFPELSDLDIQIPDGFKDISKRENLFPCFYDAEKNLLLVVVSNDNLSYSLYNSFKDKENLTQHELIISTKDFNEILEHVNQNTTSLKL